MPTNARRRRLVDTGGPWGTGLLLLGLASIAQGLSYALSDASEVRSALSWIGHFPSLRFWGLVWVAAGGWAVIKALTPPQRHGDVWPLVGITCLWAGAYLAYWLTAWLAWGELTRDWTAAVAWGSLASLIICWGRCVNPPTRSRR